MNMTILDTPDQIAFAQLASIKGAVKSELVGLKRRGQSAYSIAKQKYGLKGNKQAVYNQLQKMVNDILNQRESQ